MAWALCGHEVAAQFVGFGSAVFRVRRCVFPGSADPFFGCGGAVLRCGGKADCGHTGIIEQPQGSFVGGKAECGPVGDNYPAGKAYSAGRKMHFYSEARSAKGG